MPQEKKKRGRREQQKQKRKHSEASPADAISKKQHLDNKGASDRNAKPGIQDAEDTYDPSADFVGLGLDRTSWPKESSFFGLLDEEEQAYYANANSKLELDDFESPEDRALFVDAVYRESDGKELKIACSQSCSRYLERLILISKSVQLKSLWSKFRGHFLDLVQHRFASHCCETLFLKSAPIVSQELRVSKRSHDEVAEQPSMEQLFIDVAEELGESIGYLLTERFASHSVRVLFVILSGQPIESANTKSIIASRKKETIDVRGTTNQAEDSASSRREAPKSFQDSMSKLKEGAISGLNTTYLRALATHPTGNPVLQLLLRIENAAYRKTKADSDNVILQHILPGDSFEVDSDNSKFVLGLLYDSTGSRLLEAIVQFCPGKTFKKLYSDILKPKLVSMGKNDVASYVAIRVLERIGKDNLREIIELYLPDLPALIASHKLDVISVLIERCVARGLDSTSLEESIKSAYGNDSTSILPKMLDFDISTKPADTAKLLDTDRQPSPTQRNFSPINPRGALLAQTMVRLPGFATIVQRAIVDTPVSLLIIFAIDPVASRVIQEALTARESTLTFRRQLVPKFYSTIAALSLEGSGSRVVDCLWPATADLHYMKEHIASEISANEAALRESTFGRAVWRNWKVDLYRRRRMQWNAEAKGIAEENANDLKASHKSRIELARSRFAAKQAQQPWLKQQRRVSGVEVDHTPS
ncbi:MAG: hypothetical protein Q9160_002899 [Pyrenula sp. 1 TL-2023]